MNAAEIMLMLDHSKLTKIQKLAAYEHLLFIALCYLNHDELDQMQERVTSAIATFSSVKTYEDHAA